MTGVLAVVLGRAGSKGLPGKNARPLAGRPMVCYAIDDARRARAVDRVVVSTDGAAIAAAACAMGVEVVDRPARLATDVATVDAAARHALDALGARPDVVVLLYANVPVRPPGLIDDAVGALRRTGADSVQSYGRVGKHHPHWMVELDAAGRVRPLHPGHAHRRQDLPPLLLPDGGVIAVTAASLRAGDERRPHAFLGADRRGIVSPGRVVDVDDETDFLVAEALVRAAAATRREVAW